MPKKIIRNIWVLVVSAVLLYSAGCEKEVEAGPAAPDFSLPTLSGETVSLGAYEGYVVLLDFWATWCPPCRMSIPELVKLQNKYKKDGFVVLGVSMDDPSRISDQDLESFKKMARINYPILRYNEKIVGDYFQNGRVSLPTMFIIDRQGNIKKRIVGFDHSALRSSLADLIE